MLELADLNADSLVKMLKASFSLRNWTAMITIADKLLENVAVIHGTSPQGSEAKELQRSLVYYFGFSLCAKGIALQKLGDHKGARQCIEKYADLSWTKLEDEESLSEIEYYKNIAIANSYVVDLLDGNQEVLPEYVQFVMENSRELIPGLITILESALKHNYSVNWALNELQDEVEIDVDNESRERVRNYTEYLYLLSVYNFKEGKIIDAINQTLENIVLSGRLNDETGFRKGVAFFEMVRSHADASQQQEYYYIMKNILEREFNDEKDTFVVNNRFAD
ncbi:DNA-binding protein [Paenibacillus sp. FSL R7-0302]|uniref:DNA-binding protein n=1 Tax=Paenibacillus sp. FSL R7-0302 TaxID=2921681 RepID=UPI0030FA56E5